MSYPGKMHTLVVEDEAGMRENYKITFDTLGKKYPLAVPTFAVSYDDACAQLASPAIYHLVIIDLGLPFKTRQEAQSGVEPGLELVKRAASREHHPVPAILVISGRLGLTKLPDLTTQIVQGFWYGQAVNKGTDEHDEIEKAVRAVEVYNGIGIHLQDGGHQWYPTITPREDDLLRRCALRVGAIGVDVRWWGAEKARSEQPEDANNGSTKVLMGRFILDHGREHSRATFFKFEPAANGPWVFKNADILDQKLRHIKVVYKHAAPTRSMLVTQSVSAGEPTSLVGFLRGDPAAVGPALGQIVQDIHEQLYSLGTLHDDQIPLRNVFWEYLAKQTANLVEAWKRHASADLPVGGVDPLSLFTYLNASDKSVWVKFKTCNHGDLNASNVALEKVENSLRAFIFDAGSVEQAIAAKDLAYLEVTTLLFARGEGCVDLVDECRGLYEGPVAIGDGFEFSAGGTVAQNVKRFIAEIRRAALASTDASIYALLVFDVALQQLAGLVVQSSGNKIADPRSAAKLVALVAVWISKIAPEYGLPVLK